MEMEGCPIGSMAATFIHLLQKLSATLGKVWAKKGSPGCSQGSSPVSMPSFLSRGRKVGGPGKRKEGGEQRVRKGD